MANLTFREYTAALLLLIFASGMMVNFSGSMFKSYDSNVSSKTLQTMKNQADVAAPNTGEFSNRTQSIDIEDQNFLSPSGFGIVQDIFSSTTDLGTLAGTVKNDLGLPSEVFIILVALPVAGLIYQMISLLFGYNA